MEQKQEKVGKMEQKQECGFIAQDTGEYLPFTMSGPTYNLWINSSMCYAVYDKNPPNIFYRCMQKIVFGFRYEIIKVKHDKN